MGLDYSKGCVNFRDVGECVNLLAGRDVLPLGVILRGGKLDSTDSGEQICCPGTIINLRKGPDPADKMFDADHWHFPISNDHEKYDTTDRVVKRWLNDIFACLENQVVRSPVLFHCTSGKDRTGVVVAVLLTVLGIDRELIIQEYLWSDGEVSRDLIEQSLDGLGDPVAYFHKVDPQAIRKKFLDGFPT
ncbi:tyrosine-protein phosphatase [Zavarzinella formosa]|uniref:tyrosine-protein phosphatase n=1 Tax=Zavarzinella formosa TaxID=360055 RepID=UPI0002E22076|nr:tyrosine-protein phosphatase [Zavarzinella formosa]